MPDYSAGTASVRIRPNADDFIRDLRRQLASQKDPGYSVRVDADTRDARRDTAEWRKREESKAVDTQLDLDLQEAENKLRALRIRERAKKLGIKVDVEADPVRAETQLRLLRAREEARRIEIGVDVDTRRASAQLGAMRRQLEGFGRSDFLRLNLGALGLAAVGPATTGLVQLAAALQQVSQAALVVPGAMAGAASSIGTLVIGLGGVKDAYDAVSKAALSAGDDQAAQARASSAAESQLRNAVVDHTRAREDQARAYRDARNDLRDLNIEMRGGLISESRAILEAQKAREDLATGQYSDIRDAQLRVLEADQRVLEVKARNADNAEKLNEANAKGVEGSDRVVDANERLIRSGQQVSQAQDAVAAAAGKQSAAQKAAQETMDRLSPSAQKFVQTLIDMQPLWDRLTDAAQEPLFEGKAEEFEAFVTDIAPHFESGMSRISAAWNDNITALFTSLGSDTGTGLIDRILGNTGEAQERLSKAIDPLVRGIGTLSAAGTDALPRLADALGSVAARFANFIEAADQDGRLEKWINDGLDGMTSLGNSVLNIGKAFTAITQASGGGASFLQWLENLTDRMQQFLNSDEGQEKLKEFFREGLEQLQHWGELLGKLPGAFKSLADGAQPYVSTLIDLFKTLSELVGEHPDLVKAVLTAYLTWKTINPIMSGVQNSLGIISSGLTGLGTGFYRTRDDAKRAMAEVDSTFQKAGRGGSGLSKFSGTLAALGGSSAGAGIMGALATVAIPGLVFALGKLDEKNQESERKTKLLEEAQKSLEATVDRVSGKLTAQSRDFLIERSQNYDTQGTPGGGIPNISQGDALAAATSLGIAPDVYIDAQTGNPEALQRVRDILLKNNIVPELDANAGISGAVGRLSEYSDGVINRDLLATALIGDPEAVRRYTEALEAITPGARNQVANRFGIKGLSLAEIAQSLAPTGQASVLAGGRLNEALQTLPGLGDPTRQANQANYGRFRIKAGAGAPFPDNAQVNSTGTEFKVTVPGDMAGQLDRQNIPYIVNPGDGSLTATVPIDSPFIEKYEKGGLVPGRGPRVAIVHGGELVVPAPQVAALPGFEQGGLVDEHGNPVNPGAAPGPTSPSLVAPNPTASGPGIINSVLGGIASGVQGPIGNALSLGTSLAGMVTPGGDAHGAGSAPAAASPAASFADRVAGLPGIAGLIGSLGSSNPGASLMSWGSQTGQWLGNFAANTAASFGSTLWQGALGFFGLENSILSPSNVYNQSATQVAGFMLGSDGPLASLMGRGQASTTAGLVDPSSLASQYGVTLDDATLRAIYGGGSGPADLASLGNLSDLPSSGGEGKLQINTIRGKRAIEAMFPQITNIGGYRQDPLKWHPNGLALDVMIPGAGGLNDPTPAEGKALGDQIYAWLNANKQSLGIDYILWQEKDHFNHLHVNFSPSGYPGMAAGGPTPSRRGPGPTGGYIAEVHPDEFMISARGRATVPDTFLHKLNAGLVDPKELPGFAPGGAVTIRQGLVVPPPRPDFQVPNAKTITPTRPAAPSRPTTPAPVTRAPAAAPAPTPIAEPVAPVAPAPTTSPPVSAAQAPVPRMVAPAPGSLNHNLDWINTAISSGASAIGQALSTALGIGGAAAGGFGGAALGAAGPYAAGLVMQGGKVVEKMANVVSSALVGNVPGSFGGEPGARAYGKSLLPEQVFPDGSVSGGRTVNNTFNGISDITRLMDRLELSDKVAYQSEMANHRK